MSGRNKTKQVTLGALFSIPLAIALTANPPGWSAAGISIAVALAIAIYYLAAVLITSDSAWNDIHQVAHLLSEQDLRAASLPPMTRSPPRIGRDAARWASSTGASRDTREPLELAGQANRSAAVAARRCKPARRRQREPVPTHGGRGFHSRGDRRLDRGASATVRQNADSARSASELAAAATVKARGGAQVAARAAATMDKVEASAKRISDIISVIDGIAFQTKSSR
jgi:hypothetical protein